MVFVTLSNPRLMPGHTLVIPKRHVPSFLELSESERNELFATAICFQEKLKKLWRGGGCDLTQHDRPFMPTTRLAVPQHLHIHLRPRTWKDELYRKVQIHEAEIFQTPSPEELDQLAALLSW